MNKLEEDIKKLKREKEFYEYAYNELRKQWNRVISELLGGE